MYNINNYVEYGLDRQNWSRTETHPLSKQPIWCQAGVSFREFILRESRVLTTELLMVSGGDWFQVVERNGLEI